MQGLLHANDIKLVVIFSTIEFYIHTAVQFSVSYTVTARAESVDGSTPTARVTWSTTAPPECVAAVRVEFRTSIQGPVVATYTTNDTSQTEVIQAGLQCATNYYITVVVTGPASDGLRVTLHSRPVQVFVGGKEIVSRRFNYTNLMVSLSFFRHTYSIWSKS